MKLLLSLLLAIGWSHDGRIGGSRIARTAAPSILRVLPCVDACDFQFVADDWSSGNWAARVGAWTATKTGTPVKTSSAVFVGRSYLDAWSASNFFTVAANAAHTIHATDKVSYEWILNRMPAVAGNTSWFGNIVLGNTGGLFVYVNTSNRVDIEVANTTATAYLGGLTGASAYVTDKPVLITMTVDVAAPLMNLYVNGVAIVAAGTWPDNTTSGSLVPADCALGIGGRWSCASSAIQNTDATIGVIEVVRHQRILSAAEVAARAAQFNTLKGY